jgi:hypothetical protein
LEDGGRAKNAAGKSDAGKGDSVANGSGVKKTNLTDPGSRQMRGGGRYLQGFNGRVAVEGESRMIVAASLVNDVTGYDQLLPVIGMAAGVTGVLPERVLADS